MKYRKRSNQSDSDARPRKKNKDGSNGAKRKKAAGQLSKALMDVLPKKSTHPPAVENRMLVSSLPDIWKTSKDLGLRLFIFLCDDQTIQKLVRAPSLVSGATKKKVGATDPLLVLNLLLNAWTRAGSDYQDMMEERYYEEKDLGGPAFHEITGDGTTAAGAQTAATPGSSNASPAGASTREGQATAAASWLSSSTKPLGSTGGASASSGVAKYPFQYKVSDASNAAAAGRPFAGALQPKVSKKVALDLNDNVVPDALPACLRAWSTGAQIPDSSQPKTAVLQPSFSAHASSLPTHNLLPSAMPSTLSNNAHAYALSHGSQNAYAKHAAGGLVMAAVAKPPTYIHGKSESRLHAHTFSPVGPAPKSVQLVAPHEDGHCGKPAFSLLLEFCAQRKISAPSCQIDQVSGATFPRFQATITFCGENFMSSLKTSKQLAKMEAAQMALDALPRLRRGK